VQLLHVDAVRRRQLLDRLPRQRLDPEPLHRGARPQLAEHDPERVGEVQLVVAVGGDHERGHGLDSPAEQPKDVQRRFVRPVEVLDDQDRRARGPQLAQELCGDRVWPGLPADELLQRAARLLGDVQERPQRAGSEERVTRAVEHSCRRLLLQECTHERGLAPARLAADEDEPPRPRAGGVEGLVQGVE
jgi:hypothetical protein